MKQFLLTICLTTNAALIFAGGGFYDSFAIVDGNFHDLSLATTNPDFDGANFGNIDLNTGTLFLGGQSKTFKNNGTDVTGVAIFYRFYQGAASGAFTQVNYSFQWNQGDVGAPGNLNNSGDQQWGTDAQGANGTDGAVDILNGATLTTGTYSLEVYVRVSTNGIDAAAEIFDSNGGGNYIATFTITNAMPVGFSSLKVASTTSGHDVIFSTATETNNAYFEVERSHDSRNWSTLGQVIGAGTTQEPQEYSFLDKEPRPGLNYYRIKQVDFDGTFSYSNIISATWSTKPRIRLYPNPVANQLHLQNAGEIEGSLDVVVLDLSGKEVLRQVWKQSAINLQALPSGTYMVRLSTEEQLLLQELLIKQ